jgi:hypothetical protein
VSGASGRAKWWKKTKIPTTEYGPAYMAPVSGEHGLLQIFGPKRDTDGEWRRLHNEELHSLYCSPNIVRVVKSIRLRWAGHLARMEESSSAFKILTGKPIEMRLLGRPSSQNGRK